MSLIGILASNLFASGATQSSQNTQNTQNAGGARSTFQQLKTEFQQLGQDLQSGNLPQAQQDYATLSQNLPNTGSAGASPVLQALTQLGQDLQAGNLQAAQQDYATAKQDAQQAAQVDGHHGHHHHHFENSQSSSSSSSSSNSINQAFATLAQDLQAGNLSGAQSAFATLQNDLQHIGGYVPIALNGAGGVSGASSSAAASNLNVSA
jgi:outer membrane protein assembly factor BamD (BamD/ComL family)